MPKYIFVNVVTLNAVIKNIIIYIYPLENINGNIGNKMEIENIPKKTIMKNKE